MKHRNSKSDEQLAAILALTSDWDENKHADLTKIDYSRYKPYRSAKVNAHLSLCCPRALAKSLCFIPCSAITSIILFEIATQKSTCLFVSVGVVLRMASIILLVFIYPYVLFISWVLGEHLARYIVSLSTERLIDRNTNYWGEQRA